MVRKLWRENMVSIEVNRELYGRAVLPDVIFGFKTWSLTVEDERKMEEFEMMREI